MEMPKNVTQNTSSNAVEKASTGLHNTINKVTEATHPAVDRVASSVHQAVDKLAEAAAHTKETLHEKSDELKNAKAKLVEAAGNYVQAKPFTSLAIAATIGFFLSKIADIRSRD